MFTGIVAAVGRIAKIEPFDNNGGVRLQIGVSVLMFRVRV